DAVPCVSLRETRSRLSLRELEPLAGARPARLLPLDLARVARQQTLLTQHPAQLLVIGDERACQTHADCTGLSRLTTTVDVHQDVEPRRRLRHDQWLQCMLLVRRPWEVLGQRTPVHHELATARPEPYPCHARLSATQTVESRRRLHNPQISRAAGCCASCGCVGPAYTFSFFRISRPRLFFGSIPFTASSITRSGCR